MLLITLLILPLAGMTYVLWHVWTLLPLPDGWKWLVIALGVLCFLSLFLVFGGTMDKLPVTLSRVLYQIGTSSIFILLYLAMLFLLLDIGRAVHLIPAEWLRSNWVAGDSGGHGVASARGCRWRRVAARRCVEIYFVTAS